MFGETFFHNRFGYAECAVFKQVLKSQNIWNILFYTPFRKVCRKALKRHLLPLFFLQNTKKQRETNEPPGSITYHTLSSHTDTVGVSIAAPGAIMNNLVHEHNIFSFLRLANQLTLLSICSKINTSIQNMYGNRFRRLRQNCSSVFYYTVFKKTQYSSGLYIQSL